MSGSTPTAYQGPTPSLSLGMNMEGLSIRNLDRDQYQKHMRRLLDYNYETTDKLRSPTAGETDWILSMKEKFTLAVQVMAFRCQKLKWKNFSQFENSLRSRYVDKGHKKVPNLMSSYMATFKNIDVETGIWTRRQRQQAAEQQVRDHILENMGLYGLCKEDIMDALTALEKSDAAMKYEAIRSLIQAIRKGLDGEANQTRPQEEVNRERPQEEADQAAPQEKGDQARPQEEAGITRPGDEAEQPEDMMELALKAVETLHRQHRQ